MKVTKVVSDNLKQEFQIVIENDAITNRMTDVLVEKSKTLSMPGFRPGKVPMAIVRQRYEESALREILDFFIQDASRTVLTENKLKPAFQPTYEMDNFEFGKDLTFRLSVELLPDFDLIDYDTIKIEKISSEITEQEIDEAIKNYSETIKRFKPADKKSTPKEGDCLTVTSETKVKNKINDSLTFKERRIVLDDTQTDFADIEAVLKTKKIGETFVHEQLFPANFPQKNLAGQKAIMTITIVAHEVPNNAPITNAEILKESGAESMEQLRERVRANLTKDRNHYIHLYHKRILLDAMSTLYTFDLPKRMVDAEFDTIWSRLKAEMDDARRTGTLDAEDDKPEDTLKAEYMDIAVRRVRLGLVIAALAQKEKIFITEEQARQLIVNEAMRYPGQERKVVEFYRSNQKAIDSLTSPVLEDMVVATVLEKIKGDAKLVKADDLKKKFTGILPGFEEESAENTEAAKESKKIKTKKAKKTEESASV